MTWHRENAGEPRMPSPWLEAIRSFHALAWQDDLSARELKDLLEHPATRVAGSNPLPLPQRQHYPQPQLPAALLPASLTVSMHRQLIDCPYKFFAACGLKPSSSMEDSAMRNLIVLACLVLTLTTTSQSETIVVRSDGS